VALKVFAYGDESFYIAVDENNNIVCEEITDDFPECLDYEIGGLG